MWMKFRYDFIEFIRNGGRRPPAHVDHMTRQVSIELSSEPSSHDPQPQSPSDPSSANSPFASNSPAPGAASDRLQPLDITANPLQQDQSLMDYQPSSNQQPFSAESQYSSRHQSPFHSRTSSFSSRQNPQINPRQHPQLVPGPQQHPQVSPSPSLPPIEVAMYGRANNASDGEGDAPTGISPSSTMRDLEAACGPLSAASGSLDALNSAPTQDSGILPWLWTQAQLKCHHCCE